MTSVHATRSIESFVETADALAPLLIANADRVDRERRIPDEVFGALMDSGLLHMRMPVELGGADVGQREANRVYAALGKHCGSTAWVTMILAGVTGRTARTIPPEAVEEVFGDDPRTLVCGVHSIGAARRVDGGLVVDGTWGFASGSLHAQWAVLGVQVDPGPTGAPGADPLFAMVVIPMAELQLQDTWHVAGMRGTGSNTLVASEVFVPERRAGYLPAAIAKALHRSPIVPAAAHALLGPLIGIAEGMLRTVTENATKRSVQYFDYSPQIASESLLQRIGEAGMGIQTAILHAERAGLEIDADSPQAPMPYSTSIRAQADAVVAVRSLRAAAATLMEIGGASSFAERSPLQRQWRDLNVGSHHAMLNVNASLELYGRSLAGVEPNSRFWGPDAVALA